ncbi:MULTISPECIES: RNA recognition motif domain-containing protein [Dictyoglomus]|jgi:RNA recognition motif-containing protein|uniref:RNP-1 like RNA-binding protein n=1 Tax=Dictyoglomus turgidum (strain DSM 6724 / Z-1310) TaxID=515635 RepID=B8E1S2_DICTD|nr:MULTISPECIES: RNA-binding protein [Dictyoglomus]ACK41705.1 RNP-1 like RNA-binding protein [Dictyoglomus turgidum DSM 6724]PNV79624.1 MAG: RNA-binding protein [Dictyoglomus turgidum]HBU31802.1 RNA-binding protein [Dictyoglomus sp.]
MSKTLYVGNLPWSTTEEELKNIFASHGTVYSARIISDRNTGRSKGFGFVEVDEKEAEKMISALNNTEVKGRRIIVNEAKPREERPRERRNRG